MNNKINQFSNNINNIINKIIKKYDINSILIAFSGGQDSISLLNIIENLNNNNIHIKEIAYIYIDHQWKIDSEKHIENIINYLKYKKKPIYIYQIPNTKTSENISRIYRYHIIINHAIKYNFKAIITGHTKTDKIETFLQNLIRQTGLEGATSLNLHRRLQKNINIFRPLISINRIQTNFLCRKHNLPLWSDITNLNYNIQRNRIRNELIPYLNKYINKQTENNINYFLKTCFHDYEYIKQKVIKLYIKNKNNKYLALNYKYIKKYHINIQIRTIQLFIYHNFYIFISKKLIYKILYIINTINNIKKLITIKQYIIINIKNEWIYITLKNNSNIFS